DPTAHTLLKRNHASLASHDMVLLDGPPGDPQGLRINWRAVRALFPTRSANIRVRAILWDESSGNCQTSLTSICMIRLTRLPSVDRCGNSVMAAFVSNKFCR